MLVVNSYYTYEVSYGDEGLKRYVGGTANISSSSSLDTIFDVEIININKKLNGVGLIVYKNNEDRINSNTTQSISIYINDNSLSEEDAYVGFGFIDIKEA